MHPKSPRWLNDIATRCAFIQEVTADRSLADYEADQLLRAGIERTFEVIGEALLRIERTDPATTARITDYRRVIGFRNRLVMVGALPTPFFIRSVNESRRVLYSALRRGSKSCAGPRSTYWRICGQRDFGSHRSRSIRTAG